MKIAWNVADIPYMKVTAHEVKTDAVVAQYTVIPANPARDVEMKPLLPLQVAFGKGEVLEFQAVVPTLNFIRNFVSQGVVAKLTQFL